MSGQQPIAMTVPATTKTRLTSGFSVHRDGGSRTPTGFHPTVFETVASATSASLSPKGIPGRWWTRVSTWFSTDRFRNGVAEERSGRLPRGLRGDMRYGRQSRRPDATSTGVMRRPGPGRGFARACCRLTQYGAEDDTARSPNWGARSPYLAVRRDGEEDGSRASEAIGLRFHGCPDPSHLPHGLPQGRRGSPHGLQAESVGSGWWRTGYNNSPSFSEGLSELGTGRRESHAIGYLPESRCAGGRRPWQSRRTASR